MNDEKKANKRKLIVRYSVLAACLVAIAAVTVITVFAANNWFKTDVISNVDNGDIADDGNNDDDSKTNTDDESNTDTDTNTDADVDDEPASADTGWVTPVSSLDIITPYDFVEDKTLNGSWHFHSGLDLSAEAGTPVICCFDGTVESIVLGDQLDGNTVTISHANGVKTVYSFIEVAEGLAVGDTVKRGDTIGTVAEATGAECMLEAHLHFEVLQDGKAADPEDYLDISDK